MSVSHQLELGCFCLFEGGRCGRVEWIEPETASVYLQFQADGSAQGQPFAFDDQNIVTVVTAEEAEKAKAEIIRSLRRLEGLAAIEKINRSWPLLRSFEPGDADYDLVVEAAREVTADMTPDQHGLKVVISFCLFGTESLSWEAA
jgi:hypothetical protein